MSLGRDHAVKDGQSGHEFCFELELCKDAVLRKSDTDPMMPSNKMFIAKGKSKLSIRVAGIQRVHTPCSKLPLRHILDAEQAKRSICEVTAKSSPSLTMGRTEW